MYSIFGTTDEIVTSPIGGVCAQGKKAIYADGAWCGFCLEKEMRTWVDSDVKKCPHCRSVLAKEKRIVD